MKFELWYRIFLISGILSVIFLVTTVVLVIKFSFFELVGFRLRNRSPEASSGEKRTGDTGVQGRTSVTEEIPVRRNPASSGTVIASPLRTGTVTAPSPAPEDSDFVITRSVIITSGNHSLIE